MYNVGLVVGKFSPLHIGHQFLIDTALSQCDRVIIISYSKPTFIHCEVRNRQRWFSTLYPGVDVAIFDDYDAIPHNDDPADIHRDFCGNVCLNQFGTTVDAVFSSEDYGDGFAVHLSAMFGKKVDHVCVDIDRTIFAISGTKARINIKESRHMVSEVVYTGYKPRVAILGGESTGKTTLAKDIGVFMYAPVVEEYGRWLYDQRKGHLSYEDLLLIGQNQLLLEDLACKTDMAEVSGVIICDTTPLTTMWYSQQMFGQVDPKLERMARINYDAVILCDTDFPFVQDGTRRDEAFRQAGNDWYCRQFEQRNIPYTTVSGDMSSRKTQAIAIVEQMKKDFYL